jgi:hypothetical protein
MIARQTKENRLLNAVMVELPRPVFDQLTQVADRQKRSVPELVDAFVKGSMPPATLQDEVERDLFALSGFPSEVLIMLIQNTMPPAYQEELATLNKKAQRTALLSSEEQERQTYLHEYYQQAILRRSLCLEILQRRGYDVSNLLQPPTPVVL